MRLALWWLVSSTLVIQALCSVLVIVVSPPAWETGRSEDERASDMKTTLDGLQAASAHVDDVRVELLLISPAEERLYRNAGHGFTLDVKVRKTELYGPNTVLDYWKPLIDSNETVIFVQDDFLISPHMIGWSELCASTYGRRADIAALAFQGAQLSGRSPDAQLPAENAFLYQRAEGLRIFSPQVDAWRTFGDWMRTKRSEWYKFPPNSTISGEGFFADKNGGDLERAHWSYFFTEFMIEYGLYVLYPNLPDGKTIATPRRPAISSTLTATPEFRDMLRMDEPLPLLPTGLTRWSVSGEKMRNTVYDMFKDEQIDKIAELGWKQGGFISFTVINKAFLATAKSWLCNVDVGGFRPPGIVWIVNDEDASAEMRQVADTETVFLSEMGGGKQGTEFGNPGYWLLMLERTLLIQEILSRGISIFNFETDQIWLEDPLPHVQRLLREGADLVGTINTREEISGNLFYMKASLNLRRMWSEVCDMFLSAYKKAQLNAKKSKSWTYIQNDQSLLTNLVLRDHSFKRIYPVHFLTLDTQRFVDGRWYEKDSEVYTSERSKKPVLINNNFIIGVDLKEERARKFGHWFWNEKSRRCDENVVRKALGQKG